MISNSSSHAPALIDFDQLHSACDGDAVLMRELMELYFQQGNQIMTDLRLAINQGNLPQVDHLSHKLAGSSLAVGMTPIVASLRHLEHSAKSGHLNGAQQHFAEAEKSFDLIRATMGEYLRQ
jgi:HPt (histidine-containing phosphotransfer) domain-containing protein